MQKAVYRWRSEPMIRARIIFDMLLDQHARSARQTAPKPTLIPFLFAHLTLSEAAA
jgi:hypothetical protein